MENTDTSIDDVAGAGAGTARSPNNAVRDTAQDYLNAAGMKVDLGAIEQTIRSRALFSLGIAATMGFVLGGGLATRPGVIMLGLLGRTAARHAAMNIGRQALQNAGSFA